MATETFFKEIVIGEEAADRLIAEIEKPKEKHIKKIDLFKEWEESKKWLEERRLKKLSAQNRN